MSNEVEALVDQFLKDWVRQIIRERHAGKMVGVVTCFCDSCEAFTISDYAGTSKAMAAFSARRNGWKQAKGTRAWRCPECLERLGRERIPDRLRFKAEEGASNGEN